MVTPQPSRLAALTLFAIVVGIGLASRQPTPTPKSWLTCSALFLGWFSFKRRRFAWPLVIVAGALAGNIYTHNWRGQRFATYLEEKATFRATIIEPPDTRQSYVYLTVLPSPNLVRSGNQAAKLLVRADRYPLWHYGDELEISGKIEKPEPFDSFNYPLYLERFGIFGLVNRPQKLTLLSNNKGNPFMGWLYRLSSSLERRIQQTLPEPESSFLGGILLGSRRAIPEKLQDAFKYTGTSHIVAISGANITIVLSILLHLLPIYRKGSQWLVIMISGTFLTLLTGASASVMRGAVVAILGSYLKLRSRQAWATQFLLLSMVLMLIGNPLLLIADAGFQLSFAAFSGLAYLGKPLASIIDTFFATKKLPDILKSSLAETAAATIGTMPLSLLLFKQLSLIGLLVNPLILWLLPAISLLGLALIIGGWIPGIAILLMLPLWLLLRLVLIIITRFSHLPIGVINIGANNE